MKELIKIEKRVIGAEELNAVNARELCGELGIKKQYSSWITAQIARTGLRENIDYIVVSQKVEAGKGVSTRKEYYLTTDASKHIAMMSQGQKAKEVRDYFIAVEKEMKRSGGDANAMMPMFVEFMNAQQKQNEMMAESMKLLTSLVSEMKNTQVAQLSQKPQRVNTTISARQMDKLNAAVRNSAVHIAKFHKLDVPTATRVLYGELNGRMGVSTYYQILEKDFMRAMIFVKSAGEKAKLEVENINEIFNKEICKVYNEYDDSAFDEPEKEEE